MWQRQLTCQQQAHRMMPLTALQEAQSMQAEKRSWQHWLLPWIWQHRLLLRSPLRSPLPVEGRRGDPSVSLLCRMRHPTQRLRASPWATPGQLEQTPGASGGSSRCSGSRVQITGRRHLTRCEFSTLRSAPRPCHPVPRSSIFRCQTPRKDAASGGVNCLDLQQSEASGQEAAQQGCECVRTSS